MLATPLNFFRPHSLDRLPTVAISIFCCDGLAPVQRDKLTRER